MLAIVCDLPVPGGPWIFVEFQFSYLRDHQGVDASLLAEFALDHRIWFKACPPPWVVYSALGRRRELSSSAVFVFAGIMVTRLSGTARERIRGPHCLRRTKPVAGTTSPRLVLSSR